MNVTTQQSGKGISSILAEELAVFGERVSAAIELCGNEKECAALEDALQALSQAKTSLDRSVS
ncbi:hypothetical protein J7S78_14105 [Klebsiella oxytoca]|uniref:Uncharacterized protein n=1 Tax=Klebsiella oxytoca TaxID=571 RepID=A0AAP2FK66_KLEOX|nr:hypothetical protein [Klebsiella oxytoca]MBQ0600928.1 hypothetical protein [Klebsiella oxytoca]